MSQPTYNFSNFVGCPGGPGNADGIGGAARFCQPYSVAVDGAGNVYVADTFNNTIRKVTPAGVVVTIGGNGMTGGADGIGAAAVFNSPTGIAVDLGGNLFITDTSNNRIAVGTPVPSVTGIAHNADGSLTLSFWTLPNSVARLWTATDLTPPIAWSPIFTNSAVGPSGVWQFIDTNPAASPARYYRLSMP